jgi:serine/threonine-protein kinase
MVSAVSYDPRDFFAAAQVGKTLNGKWRLVRLLGVGGSAAVYEAAHANGRRAALKLFAFEETPTEVLRARARYESRIANAIGHPGVVAVLDDDVAEDGSVYLVMELLEGQTYEEARARRGRLPLDEAARMLVGLLEILDAMHTRGIVHRDVKPGNVLLTKDGQVKLLDLGLARAGKEDRERGEWFGTPGFLPPEQARGAWSELDATTDLWAAAATFFTVLTGRLVHDGDTTEVLVRAAARGEAQPLYLTGQRLATSVVDVISRGLAYDKSDRWPSARAMARALRAALRGAPPSPACPPVPPWRFSAAACRSATRVFRLEQAGCAGGPQKARCVLCPVCPFDDRALASAERADVLTAPEISLRGSETPGQRVSSSAHPRTRAAVPIGDKEDA